MTPKLKRLARVSVPLGIAEEIDALEEKDNKLEEKTQQLEADITILSEGQNSLLNEIKQQSGILSQLDKEKLSKSDLEVLKLMLKGDRGEPGLSIKGDKGDTTIVDKIIETVIRETPIVTEVVKEVAVKDTPDAIVEKLETLKDDDRLSATAIKGLEVNPKLSDSIINRAIGIVDQRTSFLINKVSNLSDRVDTLVTTESDPLSWSKTLSQTSLTGNKSGSFDLTTTGVGIFGEVNAPIVVAPTDYALYFYGDLGIDFESNDYIALTANFGGIFLDSVDLTTFGLLKIDNEHRVLLADEGIDYQLPYWTRSGTTLSPVTTGDNILITGTLGAGAITTTGIGTLGNLQVTGVSDVIAPEPTGTPTATLNYGTGDYTADGQSFILRAYTYKTSGANTYYSNSYIESEEYFDDFSVNPLYITWHLPALPSGATGWRILIYNTGVPYNFDYYYDQTTSNNFNDGGGAGQITWTLGSTVTPKSYYPGTSIIKENFEIWGLSTLGITYARELWLGGNNIAPTTPGINFWGKPYFGTGTGDNSSISFFYGYGATGNQQMWFGNPSNLGNYAKNFFRYWFYNDMPIVSGVNGDNTVDVPLTLGYNSRVYIGGTGATDDGTSATLQVQGTNGLSLAGKVKRFNNVNTEGYGVPAIVDDVGLTNQTAAISATNFTNAGSAGQYRVSFYLYTTSQDVTAGSFALTIITNDGTSVKTVTMATIVLTSTATGYAQGSGYFKLGPSGNVQYSTTLSGIMGTSKYALYLSAERLN